MNKTIETKDPADLRLHPLQKKYIPEPDKTSAEWHSFVDGLSAAGPDGIPPLVVTLDGQIMEGGRRWRAARQLAWPQINTVTRPAEDAAALMVESLLGQRNMQRCAKVYIALALLPEFVESAEFRRLEHLRNGVKTLEKQLSSHSTAKGRDDGSLRDLAEKFGVSKDTIRRCQEAIKCFAEDADFKAVWEPKLLDGRASVWNVVSAFGGAGADQKNRASGVEQGTFEFWTGAFAPLTERAASWNRLAAETRHKITAQWAEAAKAMPKELRAAIVEVLQQP